MGVYDSFGVGYGIDQFLKIYSEAIGLDGLEVTHKSSDGGVDLKGLKRWFDGLTDSDSVKYYVQSKRHRPGSSVSIESI